MRASQLSLALLLIAPAGCVRQTMAPAMEGDTDDVADAPPRDVRELDVRESTDSSEAPGTPASDGALVGARAWRPPPPQPILFRLGAGYGALGRLDLAVCREQGLPSGYLHVRVTFRGSGRIVHAAVEGPSPPPQQALECIGDQLTMALVPAFDGEDVTLSKNFFVN